MWAVLSSKRQTFSVFLTPNADVDTTSEVLKAHLPGEQMKLDKASVLFCQRTDNIPSRGFISESLRSIHRRYSAASTQYSVILCIVLCSNYSSTRQ